MSDTTVRLNAFTIVQFVVSKISEIELSLTNNDQSVFFLKVMSVFMEYNSCEIIEQQFSLCISFPAVNSILIAVHYCSRITLVDAKRIVGIVFLSISFYFAVSPFSDTSLSFYERL